MALYDKSKEFFMNNELSDFKLTCNGREFPVHRMILALHSEFFRRAFSSGFKESKEGVMDFPDDDPEILEKVLSIMYRGNYDDKFQCNLILGISDARYFEVLETYLDGGSNFQPDELRTIAEYMDELYTNTPPDTSLRWHTCDLIKSFTKKQPEEAKKLRAALAGVFTAHPSFLQDMRDCIFTDICPRTLKNQDQDKARTITANFATITLRCPTFESHVRPGRRAQRSLNLTQVYIFVPTNFERPKTIGRLVGVFDKLCEDAFLKPPRAGIVWSMIKELCDVKPVKGRYLENSYR
ncbi:hypothetical protein BJ166DRAFT_500167 [Pestalotiopsis sp. NC0098]|nr:hypothetical protein BJ166DRAFT_500167 [Pestalotiopsis sp. NC0098]